MKALIFPAIFAALLYPQSIPTPTLWPGNRGAAVSLTFDDNHPVQLKYALPELDKRNLKGTFFVIAGDAGWASYGWTPVDWSQAKAIADSGHEIGGHAVTHSPSAAEVKPALDSLKIRFPNKKWWTWAYPGGDGSAMSEVKKWFISARGWTNQGVEDNVPGNSYMIKTVGDAGIGTIADITVAVNKSGWLVETIHCIWKNYAECSLGRAVEIATFTAHLDTLVARRAQIWTAPYGDVFRYIQERENAQVALTASDAMTQTFNLTDTLPDSVYNLPLTLVMTLPTGWTNCTVTQNGKSLSPILQLNRVMFDAIPDKGPIVVSKTILPVSPFNVSLWTSNTPEGGSGPSLSVYLAPQGKANGAAVVICPGGGYGTLVTLQEGTQIAQWLNTQGIAGIVLPYRLAHHPVPLEDGQRAIRLVRAKAAEWGIDTGKIGMIGFSAGGHLASTVGVHFNDSVCVRTDTIDNISARPSFLILIYPVISFYLGWGPPSNVVGSPADPVIMNYLANDRHVSIRTPPSFLAHAADDGLVPPVNSRAFYDSCLSKHVPAELHIYPHGGHGFYPYDSTISLWAKDGLRWLNQLGISKSADSLPTGLAFSHGNTVEMPQLSVHPNPFNPVARISYTTPVSGFATLAVYDLTGRILKKLVSGEVMAGRHTVIWDATDAPGGKVSCGAYLYRLTVNGRPIQTKGVLAK